MGQDLAQEVAAAKVECISNPAGPFGFPFRHTASSTNNHSCRATSASPERGIIWLRLWRKALRVAHEWVDGQRRSTIHVLNDPQQATKFFHRLSGITRPVLS